MIDDYINVEETDSDFNQSSPGIQQREPEIKDSESKMEAQTHDLQDRTSILENDSKDNKNDEKLSQHQVELLKLIKEMEIEEKSQNETDDAPGPKANFGRVVDDKAHAQPFLCKPNMFGSQQKSAPQHFNQPNPDQGRSIAASIQKNISTAKQHQPYLSMETQRAMQNAPIGMSNVLDEFKVLTQQRQKRRARVDNFEQTNYDTYSGSNQYTPSYNKTPANSYNPSSGNSSASRNLPVRTASFTSIPTEISGSQKIYPEPSYQGNYYGFKTDQHFSAERNNVFSSQYRPNYNLQSQCLQFGNSQQSLSNPRQIFKSKAVIQPTILQTQPTAHHPTIRTTPHQIFRPKTNPNQVITVRGSSGMNQNQHSSQPRSTFYPSQPQRQLSNSINNSRPSYVQNTPSVYTNQFAQPVQRPSHYSQSLDRSQPYFKNPTQHHSGYEQTDYSDF